MNKICRFTVCLPDRLSWRTQKLQKKNSRVEKQFQMKSVAQEGPQ